MVWKIDNKRVQKNMTFTHKRYRTDDQCLILSVRDEKVTFVRLSTHMAFGVRMVNRYLPSDRNVKTVTVSQFESLFGGWGDSLNKILADERTRRINDAQIAEVYTSAHMDNMLFDVRAAQGEAVATQMEMLLEQMLVDARADGYNAGDEDGYERGVDAERAAEAEYYHYR